MSDYLRRRHRQEAPVTKGSRFIATAAPVTDEGAARAFLAGVEAELPDATHHCWAWRIEEPAIDRAGDAGEPGGSAGRPILAQLVGRNLVDTAVIVSRWFGGTKLGVGGLVRAYGGAAALVLDNAVTVPRRRWVPVSVTHLYADGEAVERALSAWEVDELDVVYGATVTRHLKISDLEQDPLAAALADATAGRVVLEPGPPDPPAA